MKFNYCGFVLDIVLGSTILYAQLWACLVKATGKVFTATPSSVLLMGERIKDV